MKSVERIFNKIIKQNPTWSSYLCFAKTIRIRNSKEKTIRFWFHKLVDPKDYAKDEKKIILRFLLTFKKP